jgi:glycosyltransferase involved in cell wall biosynthesis
MNVLHINQSDIFGGAAIAAYRLHQGLLTQGIDSYLLVGRTLTSSQRVAIVPRWPHIETQLFRLGWLLGLNYLNHMSTFTIHKHPFFKKADILHLHNLHTGYFNYLAIASLTKLKPAVFTLRDMWSFTGHCSYSYECDRWKIGCGKCPHRDTYPEVRIDNTRLEWKLKNWVYSRSKLTIVTLSRWLAEQARESMLGRFPIYHIANGIDTDSYQPLDQKKCRSLLGIPLHKNVLMFGAFNQKSPRKGGDLLLKALQDLPNSLKGDLFLLTIGEAGEAIAETSGISTQNLGFISSDRLKSIAYSAADLFLFPTRAEAFGQVAQEALTCGTPVVSFNVDGVPDLVRPGITGYLAKPDDHKDFSNGILQLLEDEKLRLQMSRKCREIAIQEYNLEKQTKRYIELYDRILSERRI